MCRLPESRPRILGLSGSLRAKSSNSSLVALCARLAAPWADYATFAGIAELPHFNPDLDGEDATPPGAVAAWRDVVRTASGLVISCPEYAHGLPGSFKNALDWLVSSAELMDKPILLLNASAGGGEFAQRSLVETLAMLGASVLAESQLAPFVPPGFRAEEPDAGTLAILRAGLEALGRAASG